METIGAGSANLAVGGAGELKGLNLVPNGFKGLAQKLFFVIGRGKSKK